jgi:glyoxylase-like metal-dependent hydrolase (beta-lactamase superfamily II)
MVSPDVRTDGGIMKREIIAGLLLALSAPAAKAASAPLQLDVYTAPPEGFGVTSTLIFGPTEAILVDAQFRNSDAEKVADKIVASGKKLKAIFVTHAHPEHYFGSVVLRKRFPGVPVYMTNASLKEFKQTVDAKIKQWGAVYKDEIPAQVPAPQKLPSRKLRVDGQLVQVVRDLQGDSKGPTNSYVWVPSASAEVAGDIVFQRTHVWLAESTPKTRKSWLASLRKLAKRHPQVLVAGHKRSADAADSPGAVDFTRDYIRAFETARSSSHDADELIAKMRRRDPDLALDTILTFAANAAFPK